MKIFQKIIFLKKKIDSFRINVYPNFTYFLMKIYFLKDFEKETNFLIQHPCHLYPLVNFEIRKYFFLFIVFSTLTFIKLRIKKIILLFCSFHLVGHTNSKEQEIHNDKKLNEKMEVHEKINETIALKQPHVNGTSHEKKSDIENEPPIEEDILNTTDIDENADAVIDEKLEKELLQEEGENEVEEQANSPTIAHEFIELFESVSSEKKESIIDNNEQESSTNLEEKKEEEIADDTNLLDECESPRQPSPDTIQNEDENSTEPCSNDDGDSNNIDDKRMEHETEKTDEQNDQVEDIGGIDEKDSPCEKEEDQKNDEKDIEMSTDDDQKIEEKEAEMAVVKKSESVENEENSESALLPAISINKGKEELKERESEKVESKENSELIEKGKGAVAGEISEDVEMMNVEENKKEEDDDIKMDHEQLSDKEDHSEKSNVIETKDENVNVEKPHSEIKSDNFDEKKNVEPVKFNFMKKFSTQIGKLSRDDLEEMLLQKITESLVFRSECAELRSKHRKQEETIDNLQKRLAVVTKQYNDLDMIHKRVEKDLRDRPDGPVQPVRITRAVGLQVFLESKNSTNQNNIHNNQNIQNQSLLNTHNVTNAQQKMKQQQQVQNQILSFSNPQLAASILLNKNASIKRLNDSATKSNTEPEPKRKKATKFTPLRPLTLSEKEECSLKLQEASIEQHLRAKVTKTTNPAVKLTVFPNNGQTNGIGNRSM